MPSTSETPRPSRSAATTSANSSASSSATGTSRPLAIQSEKAGPGAGMARLQHDLVDDQLADIKQQQRLHGAQQPEHDARDRQRRAGAPDLREEALQVPERRQLFAERRLVGGRAAESEAGGEILT